MHRFARLLVSLLLSAVSSLASVAIAADAPPPPKVDAPAYILIDQASGRTLASERADERAEPASITKLMTAYVTFRALKEGRLKLDELVSISERAWRAEGSRTFLNVGDRVPVEVLLQGMIVQSGNDAATALAERLGGSEDVFGQIMTREAKRLGMKNSNFTNATGLPDPALYTTPRDIAILSRALIDEFPQYYRWYSQREFVWNNIKQGNRNGLLYSDPTADGIKTGFTDSAGYCLASSAKRNGTRMIAVVFGTQSPRIREQASTTLLNYGFAFYETVHLRKVGDAVFKPRVYKGSEQYVSVGPASNVEVTVARGTRSRLKTSTTLNEPLVAPLKAGQTIGEMRVLDGKTVVKRVPLVVNDPVPEGGLWAGTRDTFALWFR
ncbi:MAG: D-alanyl-D-alanine carboxypeptidase [Gammaproteobacteria bacterium]|jgi:D-alanyl-D-alanine carboxypeptidase (penicillin-binding protein 5/6)|nr:D-alanyl-D-alanine carboxypeptidase [Gammaproteobacteria bacterium]